MSHQQVLPPKVNKLEGNPDAQVANKTPGKQKAMCLILSACGGAMVMVEPNKKDTRARGSADVAPRQEGMHSAEAQGLQQNYPLRQSGSSAAANTSLPQRLVASTAADPPLRYSGCSRHAVDAAACCKPASDGPADGCNAALGCRAG